MIYKESRCSEHWVVVSYHWEREEWGHFNIVSCPDFPTGEFSLTGWGRTLLLKKKNKTKPC